MTDNIDDELGSHQLPNSDVSDTQEKVSDFIQSSLGEEEISTQDLTAVYNVPVQVSAVLGRSTMPVSQLLKLGRGAVVELDRRVGEAIDIFVNNRLIARGEIVVVDDKLGITMTEIIKADQN
jgi:flagellar motor switch protein FliN/FliY